MAGTQDNFGLAKKQMKLADHLAVQCFFFYFPCKSNQPASTNAHQILELGPIIQWLLGHIFT